MAEKIVDWTHLLLQASTQSRVPPRTLWKIGLGYEATPAFCLEDTANSKKLKEQLETKGGEEKTFKTKQLMLFELVSTTGCTRISISGINSREANKYARTKFPPLGVGVGP